MEFGEKKLYMFKAEDKATFSQKTEERMFVVDSGTSMHMVSKKDLSSDEMDTCGGPETQQRCKPLMEQCKQTRRHKCMFTISICSSQCKYSKKRQQFYRLVSFAQNTDVASSGKTVKLHDSPKMGRQLLEKWTITRIVIIFQQQLGFYIKTKGSLKIFW